MFVGFYHFGKVVWRPGEGNTFGSEKVSSCGGGMERLGVEGEFARQVVIDVGYIWFIGSGDALMV